MYEFILGILHVHSDNLIQFHSELEAAAKCYEYKIVLANSLMEAKVKYLSAPMKMRQNEFFKY